MYFSIVESNINKIRILKIFSFSCFLKLKLIENIRGKNVLEEYLLQVSEIHSHRE